MTAAATVTASVPAQIMMAKRGAISTARARHMPSKPSAAFLAASTLRMEMRAKLASTGSTERLVKTSVPMPMAAVSANSRITGTGIVVTVTKVSTASRRATEPGSSRRWKLVRAASSAL